MHVALLTTRAALLVCAPVLFAAPWAAASTGEIDYPAIIKLAHLPAPLSLDAQGKLTVSKHDWKLEKDKEGTDLLSSAKANARAAVLHSSDGKPEALVSYLLSNAKKDAPDKPESSNGFFFKAGQLAAITTCEDSGEKDSLGRICVTATNKLCSNLRNGVGLDIETLTELDAYEMRALAAILTLRGSDHQLDNVLRSGNRLGLKTALQTTKGQLLALAKQLAKELGRAVPEPASTGDANEDAKISERAKADSLVARSVLEKSLPRLKQSCADAAF
jgi:hypothetical protein